MTGARLHVYESRIDLVQHSMMQAMSPAEPEMREKASRLCRDFLSGAWRKVSSEEIVVKRFSGGLSNLLYFCALPNSIPAMGSEPTQVLLRIYGQVHDDGVEAVITQSVIFTLLSERRLGPKLYGVFPGGRIEEYIPARPLLTQELKDPTIAGIIAEKMAKVHRLQVPINKEPTWLGDTMARWLQKIHTDVSVAAAKPEDQPKIRKLLSYSLEKEYDWVMKMIPKNNSPVVFSHNDLQEGNILVCDNASQKEDRLVFIDYEYCSYNYRGFDFANHFCEWGYDYTNPQPPNFYVNPGEFPNRDQQLHFIRAYLQRWYRDNPNTNNSSNGVSLQQNQKTEEIILKEVFFFTLVSHLFWAIWAVVNGNSNSEIQFGYYDYALSRFEAYLAHKSKVLSESGKRKSTNGD